MKRKILSVVICLVLVLTFTCTLVACGKKGKGGGGNKALLKSISWDGIKNSKCDVRIEDISGSGTYVTRVNVDMASQADKINMDIYEYSKSPNNAAGPYVDAYLIRNNSFYTTNSGFHDPAATEANYISKVKSLCTQNPTNFQKYCDFGSAQSADEDFGIGGLALNSFVTRSSTKDMAFTIFQNCLNVVFTEKSTDNGETVLKPNLAKLKTDLWDKVYALAQKIDTNPKVAQLCAMDEFKTLWNMFLDGVTGAQVEALLRDIEQSEDFEFPFDIETAGKNENAYDYAKRYLDVVYDDSVEVGDVKILKILKEVFGLGDDFSLTELLDEYKDDVSDWVDEYAKDLVAELHFQNNKFTKAVFAFQYKEEYQDEVYDPTTGSYVPQTREYTTKISATWEIPSSAPQLMNTNNFYYSDGKNVEANLVSGEIAPDFASYYDYSTGKQETVSIPLEDITVSCECRHDDLYVYLLFNENIIAELSIMDGDCDFLYFHSGVGVNGNRCYFKQNDAVYSTSDKSTGSTTVNGKLTETCSYNIIITVLYNSETTASFVIHVSETAVCEAIK